MFGFYQKYFTFFGVNIAYYGLVIAIGMGLGVFVACKNAKFRGLKSDDLLLLACYVLPLAIVGARIYYVLFSLDMYTSFWQVFEIWKGGLAIYGGIIGGVVGVILYCSIHKKNIFDVTDVVVISLLLGQAIGRWGNFFNQEAFGFYVDNPSLQWFPFSVYIEHCNQEGCLCGGSGWHLATFFYESLWNFITFLILIILFRKNKFKLRGSVTCLYFIIYGIGRAIIEGLRMDSLYLGSIRVSQLLSIILIIVALSLLITNIVLYKKGKIKSLTQLQSFYAEQLATVENDKNNSKNKKFKIHFKNKNNIQSKDSKDDKDDNDTNELG